MFLSKSDYKDLIYQVNGAAIYVHQSLGPGLLESVYHRCMELELRYQKIPFETEKNVPVVFRGVELDCILRCDLFVAGALPVELKSVDAIHGVHIAQLMTYMKLLETPIGLLINFNVEHLFKFGQRTVVNQWYQTLREV